MKYSIRKFRAAVANLPRGPSRRRSGKTWTNQKDHWLGWLKDYHKAGYYRRKGGPGRDARFAYNHVLDYEMVTWLAGASGVKPARVRAAKSAARKQKSMQAQAAAARREIPWEMVEEALAKR